MLNRFLPIVPDLEALGGILWAETPEDVADLLRGFADAEAPLRPIGQGRRVAIQVGYYFRDPPLVLASGPAVADLKLGKIGLDARVAREWLARTRSVALDRREIPMAAGVGDHATEHLTGPRLRRAVGCDADEPCFTDARRHAFGAGIETVAVSQQLPDAILLHDDTLSGQITLTLEPTTACNFDCGFCYGRHLPIGLLRLSQIEKVLNHLPEVTAVEITGEGEPLINKDIFKMIALFKQRGIWVHLTTNGSRLDDHMVGQILDSGVDRVAVSLESVQPDRHERLRPGSNFTAFRDGLIRLRDASRRRAPAFEMYLWVNLLRDCIDGLDAMFAFADEIGFDCVEMQALNAMQPYVRVYSERMRQNLMSLADLRALRDNQALGQRARSAVADLVSVYNGERCTVFDSSAMVYWQGRMTPCRLLKLPDVPAIGSLVDTPIETLWQGENFRRFRFALRHGLVLNCCSGCSYIHAAETASRRT